MAPTDPPLMQTAGALGDERPPGSRKRKHRKKGESGPSSKRHKPSGQASNTTAPPVYSDAPLTEKNNLAGAVDAFRRGLLGVRSITTKTCKPYGQVNLATEPFVTFCLQARKNEFIRLKPDSVSLVVYATYLNPDRKAAGHPLADDETMALRWALRAGSSQPAMLVDPAVQATGFFHRVEVTIDNVPVATNSEVNNLLQHYVRCARIYTDKPPGEYLKNVSEIAWNGAKKADTPVMLAATDMFDYTSYQATVGKRVPVYLDGIFPFDLKNRTLESIDHSKEPCLYLPPDTTVMVKLHAHRTKQESLFHPEISQKMNSYFTEEAVGTLDALGMRLTIQDACLEYESVELHPTNHAQLINSFRSGGRAVYNYDRVCGQHSAIMPGLSYTETRFQIPPYARLAYILFLPDHATFVMDQSRKPLSALSRFPAQCSGISVSFAGESHLVCEKFENFGVTNTNHAEVSKKIYWEYLRNNSMIAASFAELFPIAADRYSLIQALVFDLRNLSSQKTETLSVGLEFAGEAASPKRRQIAVLTVHPSGQLQCTLDNNTGRWVWVFQNRQ